MFTQNLLAAGGSVGIILIVVAVLILVMLLLVIMTRIKTCPPDKVLVDTVRWAGAPTERPEAPSACTAASVSSFPSCKNILSSI